MFLEKALISTTSAFLLICLEDHDKCELFSLLAGSIMECHTNDQNRIEFSNS